MKRNCSSIVVKLYHLMNEMSNISISYEQKNEALGNSEIQIIEKQGIGRLLSKQQRLHPFDEQQEQLIGRKNKINHENSLKYSHIYANLQMNHNGKILPNKESEDKHYSLNQEGNNSSNQLRQDIDNKSNALYAPKSLPKIMRNSRVISHSEDLKWNTNLSVNEHIIVVDEKHNLSHVNTFSINHFEIYKPIEHKYLLESRKKQFSEYQSIQQKPSHVLPISSHKILQQQHPQTPLMINFEDQLDKQLPQPKDETLQVSEYRSKVQDKSNDFVVPQLNPMQKQKILGAKNQLIIRQRKQSTTSSNKEVINKTHEKIKRSSYHQDLKKNELANGQILIRSREGNELKGIQFKNNKDQYQHFQSKVPQNLISNSPEGTNKMIQKQNELALNECEQFSFQSYVKINKILTDLHGVLKAPILDSHILLKSIKEYLYIMAGGVLDHIESFDLPPTRIKIVKNALLYERIAMVMVSFAYATGKMKESLKYLINLISYAITNTNLILKILQNFEVNPVIDKSDRLILKRQFDSVRNNSDIILDTIIKISKYQEAFCEPFKQIIKSIGKNSLEQTFYNVLQYFAFFLCISQLHHMIPFLAVAPNPYLSENMNEKPTLVIDIAQVFCYGTRKSRSYIFRPYADHFLSQMSQFYEIISFSSAYPNQIDKIIDILDSKKLIKHRLYRHHALLKQNILFKDVERIGRDVSRLVLLDSQINSIPGEMNNMIMIPIWRGSKRDTVLAELCPILATIAIKNLDCREATRKIHEQQVKNQFEGIKYLNFGINLE